MAWNPSPEVGILRDAVHELSRKHLDVKNDRINRAFLLFTTDVGAMGYVSYGADRRQCGQARRMADAAYEHIQDVWERIEAKHADPPRGAGPNPDWDGLKAEVGEKIDLLRASFEALGDGQTRAVYMRDIGLPLLELLARFCMAFQISEAP